MIKTVIDATGPKGVRDVISSPLVVTGYTNVSGVGLVPYEGPLERDFLETQDFLKQVSHVQSQPLQIQYKNKSGVGKYTPDYLLEFKPGKGNRTPSPILTEIKPHHRMRAAWGDFLPKFRYATEVCRERGWRFRIVTDRLIGGPRLASIKFLRGYLEHPDPDSIGQILFLTINEKKVSTPADLLNICFSSDMRRLEAVGVLWKLIADGRIRIDLSVPLNMNTPIWSIWHER
jgi:hypothetical protein